MKFICAACQTTLEKLTADTEASGVTRTHDISKICERYGGGGHAVVGAIALPTDIERCRQIGSEIVAEPSRSHQVSLATSRASLRRMGSLTKHLIS